VVACVRIVSGGELSRTVRTFETTTARLIELVRHRPSADPPWMKLSGLGRLGYLGAAVGKEVGFSMVRKSP
jgi:hypothetical protein